MAVTQAGALEELEHEDELELDAADQPGAGQEQEDEGGEGDQPPDEPISIEARARAMGWHPLSEYRGDPRKWTPAAEFIRKGEEAMPILRDQNRRMSEKIARMEPQIAEIPVLRTTINEVNLVVKDLRDLARKADQRGYQRALAELKAQRREAVASGDTETFERLDQQIDEIATAAKEPAPAALPPPAAAPDPAITAFRRDNPWFDTDADLNASMIAHHTIVMRKHPGMSLGGQLAEAAKRVRADYPERFDDEDDNPMPPASPQPAPRRPAAPAVGRPSPPQGRTRQTSGWDAIQDPGERAEARAAFDRMKRHQPDMSETEYLAIYLDPHADVLSMKRAK